MAEQNLPNPFHPKKINSHPNGLIQSRHQFSLLEKKMIYCIINQLDVSLNVQEDLFGDRYFKIPVSTFGEDYNFAALRLAINKITTRNITGGSIKNEHAWSITPIPWAEIKNGSVTLKLQKEAVPYFIDLKKHGFTTYQLDVAMRLTSVYSQRLYELLGRYKDTGYWHVELDKFKFLLSIDKEKTYNGITANGKIRQTILEPARLELAEKTDIEFTYEFLKEGRKFVALDFKIYTKKLIRHIETAASKEDAQEVLEELADASEGQQNQFLYTALADYQFTPEQRKRIFDNPKYQLKFIEIHTKIQLGAIKVETTRSRLMAGILRQIGWK